MASNLSINIGGDTQISADIRLQEVYEVGFNDKFKGVITTLGEQSILISGKDFEIVKKLWCESSGCDIIPVFIEVKGNTYSFNWFISDTEIREYNQSAVIKLTDNNYGSKLKSNLNINQILPFSLLEVITMSSLGRGYISPLNDRPSPNTRTFQGYRFGNIMEHVLELYGMDYEATPNFFNQFVITTRGGVAYVSRLGSRENGDFNPLVSVTLEQLFEFAYKLLGYGFVLISNKIKFVELSALQNEKDLLFQKDCEIMISEVCEDENYSSLKVGGKTTFPEFSKYKDTETPETDKNTVMSMIHNAANFEPSQWQINNECGKGDELDLSVDWLIYDSNVIEFDAEMNTDERGFEGSQDLVVIELNSHTSNTTRVVSVQVPSSPTSTTLESRNVFNRSLYQSEIIQRLACEIGRDIIFYQDSDVSIPITSQGVVDGYVYDNLYQYGSYIGVSVPIVFKAQNAKSFFIPFGFPIGENGGLFQPKSDFIGSVDLDLRISANSNLAPSDTVFNVLFAELEGDGIFFNTPFFRNLGTITFNQFEINFSTCKTFIGSESGIYFSKNKSYGIVIEGTLGLSPDYQFQICSSLSEFKITPQTNNEIPINIETNCEPYLICHKTETYLDPCKRLEGYGFMGLNGKGHQPKRIERELTTGATTIYSKTKKC